MIRARGHFCAASTLMALVAAGLTSGCVTVATTKDIVADPNRYLNTNFTPAQLNPAVRAILERGPSIPDRYKTMRVSYRIDTDQDGRKHEASSVVDFNNLGNGYVQTRTEMSKNAVPYRVNLALSFAGVHKVKTQTVFLERRDALLPIEAKELRRFDREIGSPAKGSTYVFESKTGTSSQFANFVPENISCVAGDSVPAKTVFASLSGDAVSLDCSIQGENNVVAIRTRFAWLVDYGVALYQEVADSRAKSTYTVTALNVSR